MKKKEKPEEKENRKHRILYWDVYSMKRYEIDHKSDYL